MTLYGLIASLAWAALAAFFIVRLSRFSYAWLSVISRENIGTEPIEIPDDLEALVAGETGSSVDQTSLIQDQLRTAILERYTKLKDWNKVRLAMGLGAMSEATS